MDYPASKDDLVKDADDGVLSFLRDLLDKDYETLADVNKEMG